jgi:hypothetical protein
VGSARLWALRPPHNDNHRVSALRIVPDAASAINHWIEMTYRDFKGMMKPGQNKRRGRNNNPNNPNNPNSQNNPNRPRVPHRMQTFDSSGPNVKIRGNAFQVFERYVALAREASVSGDRVAAENLYQHAEHYFRIMNANGDAQSQGAPRPTTPADTEMMNGPEPDVEEHEQRAAPQPAEPVQQHEPESEQPSQDSVSG